MVLVTTYRLCLRRPTGRIRRYWASTDEGAVAKAREMLAEDPTLIGFELCDGQRQVAQERRRAGSVERVASVALGYNRETRAGKWKDLRGYPQGVFSQGFCKRAEPRL